MIPLFRSPLIALCLALGCCAAWAERADRDKPMQVEADRLQHDEHKQLSEFIGSVQANKGTMAMRAERLEVRQDAQGRQQARFTAAAGQRVFFRQKREGLNEFIEGEAETAVYDSLQDLMTLTGRAEVRILRQDQSADQVQGQRIVYNNTTEVMNVDGRLQGGERGRARAVLAPRDTATSGASAASPAPALQTSPQIQSRGRP